MKTTLIRLSVCTALASGMALSQTHDYFTNIVRQIQYPSGLDYDFGAASSSPDGGRLSALAIDPGGARFELWTILSDPLTTYLLDSKYVGASAPVADIKILTEDPYIYTGIPRTRADRPFIVDTGILGLVTLAEEPTAPASLLSVKLLRHVQSYGEGGTNETIDRDQATLIHQVSLTENSVHRLSYAVSSVPGGDRSKIRGEERFSVFSLADAATAAPESQLASLHVQIWPVADGTISGIVANQQVRFAMPDLTITMHDLYPDSQTYVQVYKGDQNLGTEGAKISGGDVSWFSSDPLDAVRTLKGSDLDTLMTEDGRWTLEILTSTPFGIDRLDHVSFDLDRTMKVNSTVTTID